MNGLVWVTWRQHRAVVGLTAFIVVLAVLPTPQPLDSFDGLVVLAFAPGVAVFWGAPLLAREFEERTHLVAWGQDVTPARWIAVKCALLAAVLVVLGTPLGPDQVLRAVFGFFLGVGVGLVLRRTVAAMAVTFVLYAAMYSGVM